MQPKPKPLHEVNASDASRALIRKRAPEIIPYLLRQIIIVICFVSVPRFRQLLQRLRQRCAISASTIDVNKHHDGEGEADQKG
jgi:hypothetical protein